MSLIVEIDSMLLENSREYYRKANINLRVQLLVLFTFLGITSVCDSIVWDSTAGVLILLYSPVYVDNLIEWMVVIQFMNMIVWLRDRYSFLNTRLSTLSGIFEIENSKENVCLPFLERACISVKKTKLQLRGKEILTFNNIHDIMFDTVLLVKSTFEVQIFLSIISAFINITICSYFGLCMLYGYIETGQRDVSVPTPALCQMLWCLIHVAKLLCITVPCHSANNKMAQTATVLRKILLASHADPATVTELERFSRHLALRKFKFTVFGFLRLDLSLLFSMAGAVVTYLVILMQFKISINSSEAQNKSVTH
jgi:gustatory receptor